MDLRQAYAHPELLTETQGKVRIEAEAITCGWLSKEQTQHTLPCYDLWCQPLIFWWPLRSHFPKHSMDQGFLVKANEILWPAQDLNSPLLSWGQQVPGAEKQELEQVLRLLLQAGAGLLWEQWVILRTASAFFSPWQSCLHVLSVIMDHSLEAVEQKQSLSLFALKSARDPLMPSWLTWNIETAAVLISPYLQVIEGRHWKTSRRQLDSFLRLKKKFHLHTFAKKKSSNRYFEPPPILKGTNLSLLVEKLLRRGLGKKLL